MIFVTGRGKNAIEDYFDIPTSCRRRCVEKNKHDILELLEVQTGSRPGQRLRSSASRSRSGSAMRCGARAT